MDEDRRQTAVLQPGSVFSLSKLAVAYGEAAVGAALIALGFLEIALIVYTRRLSVIHHANLFSEGTFFTWFSAAQIGALSLAAFGNALLAGKRSGRFGATVRPWLMASSFFAILALDEAIGIHERVAQLSGKLITWVALPTSDAFWDVPFFALYGAAGLAIWLALKGEFDLRRWSGKYLVAGVFLLMVAVILDLFMAGILLVFWEDSFKLLGFLFLLGALASSALKKRQGDVPWV